MSKTKNNEYFIEDIISVKRKVYRGVTYGDLREYLNILDTDMHGDEYVSLKFLECEMCATILKPTNTLDKKVCVFCREE